MPIDPNKIRVHSVVTNGCTEYEIIYRETREGNVRLILNFKDRKSGTTFGDWEEVYPLHEDIAHLDYVSKVIRRL